MIKHGVRGTLKRLKDLEERFAAGEHCNQMELGEIAGEIDSLEKRVLTLESRLLSPTAAPYAGPPPPLIEHPLRPGVPMQAAWCAGARPLEEVQKYWCLFQAFFQALQIAQKDLASASENANVKAIRPQPELDNPKG